MSRSVECRCEPRFTCGYCLRNAKPYFYTLSDGSRIYELPAFLSQPSSTKRDKELASSTIDERD